MKFEKYDLGYLIVSVQTFIKLFLYDFSWDIQTKWLLAKVKIFTTQFADTFDVVGLIGTSQKINIFNKQGSKQVIGTKKDKVWVKLFQDMFLYVTSFVVSR